MRILKLIPILLIGAYLFSCQKEIDIDASSLPQKIVIDGKIESGKPPYVILRNSGFLYDTIDLEKTYIHNAVVEVFDGTEKIQLTEICYKLYNNIDSLLENNDTLSQQELIGILFTLETQDQMDSIYINYYGFEPDDLENSQFLCVYLGIPTMGSAPILGEEGKTYTLTVKDGERSVKAVTTIPEHFEIDSLTYKKNPEDNNFAEVFIHLTFPPNLILGHYIQYGSKTQNSQFYYDMRTGSVYSDATFEGSNSLKLPLEGRKYANEGRLESAERQFAKGDTVTLIWKNIDRATYEYIYTSENDGGASPFSSPTRIISNVEGGLGIWGGYNINYKSIYIP